MRYYRFFFYALAPEGTGWKSRATSSLFRNRETFEWFLRFWSRSGWLYEERPEDKFLNDIMQPVDYVVTEVILGEKACWDCASHAIEWVKVCPIDKLANYVVLGYREEIDPIVRLDYKGDTNAAISHLGFRYGKALAEIARKLLG